MMTEKLVKEGGKEFLKHGSQKIIEEGTESAVKQTALFATEIVT